MALWVMQKKLAESTSDAHGIYKGLSKFNRFWSHFFRQNWVIKRVRNSILYRELQVILTWGAPIINIPGIPLRCWNIFLGMFWNIFGKGYLIPPPRTIPGILLALSSPYHWNIFEYIFSDCLTYLQKAAILAPESFKVKAAWYDSVVLLTVGC